MRLLYLSTLFLFIFTTCILAQPTTGTIQGTMKLESGEAVADVSVAVSNQQTGLTRNAITAADGFYRFTALPPGVYSVSAEGKGFGAQKQTDVTLVVGQTVIQDFTLQMATQETLTVAADVPLVDVTKSSVGLPVRTEQIENLPLNSRNFQKLASQKRLGGVTLQEPPLVVQPLSLMEVLMMTM